MTRTWTQMIVYQVDVDFWVAKWSTAAIAIHDSFGARFRRHLIDQVNGKRRVHLLLFVNVTRQTVVVFFPFLRHDNNVTTVQSSGNVIANLNGYTHLAGVRFDFFRFPRRVLGGRLDECRASALRHTDRSLQGPHIQRLERDTTDNGEQINGLPTPKTNLCVLHVDTEQIIWPIRGLRWDDFIETLQW